MRESYMHTESAAGSTKPCELVLLLDRSGSMESTRDSTIIGYNKYLNDQKSVPGEAYVSVFQFDDKYECVYAGKPIHAAPELNRDTLVPRGSTALYDAIIRCGNAMLASIRQDHNAVFVILTDGGENASYQKEGRVVGEVLDKLRARGWQVMFIGANQDAIMSAKQMGLSSAFAMSSMANAAGTAGAYSAASSNTTSYRQTGVAKSFSRLQKQAQVDAGLDVNLAHLDDAEDDPNAVSTQNAGNTASGTVSTAP